MSYNSDDEHRMTIWNFQPLQNSTWNSEFDQFISLSKCLVPQSGIAVTIGRCNWIKHTPQRSHPKYLSSNQNLTLPILHQEVKATNVACGNCVQQIFKGCCTFDPSKMVAYSHIHEKSVEALWLPTNGLSVSKLKQKYHITSLHNICCCLSALWLYHLLSNLSLYLRHLTTLSHTIHLHIITPPTSRPEEGHWFRPCSELTPYSANGESIHLPGWRSLNHPKKVVIVLELLQAPGAELTWDIGKLWMIMHH